MTENRKQTMRMEARRARDRINTAEDNPEDAVAHFLRGVPVQNSDVIAAYWPKEREFDVRPILHECLKHGHTCALPVVQKDTRILKFALWDGSQPLEAGAFGIMQPADNPDTQWVVPDIVIVPMLAFDRRGGRLGQGGGYYDATLADLRAKNKILAVGVAYAQQACLFNLPLEEHDQKMDIIITPKGIMDFT